jgi:hypothetical protein
VAAIDVARATRINAVKCIPANVNVADLDFDPQDPRSQIPIRSAGCRGATLSQF